MALQIDKTNYTELVANSDKPVMLDFWAEWCGPCRMMSPIVDEIYTKYEGKAIVGKVNVDNNNEIATEYGIRNIPTIVFIKNGKMVDKTVGHVSKSVLEQKLEALL